MKNCQKSFEEKNHNFAMPFFQVSSPTYYSVQIWPIFGEVCDLQMIQGQEIESSTKKVQLL